ncbi:helix-turn-helix domain-containing protein [Phocaeicola sp.]
MKKDIHIGSIIKKKFEESDMTIPQFAKLINRTRTTIYDIFNRKSIDIDLLIQISEVLDYNFLEEVYMDKKKISDNKEINETRYIVGIEVTEEQLKDIDTENTNVILLKKLQITSTE